ncbi:MAG: hypothetical protein H6702_22180 [Myxococcales bacterium]|nr:hypothetical protein [Myxococcales bacterium]
MTAPDARGLARAGAALAAAQLGCLVYALDRTAAAVRHGPIDPLAIVATTRIEYFWRAGTAAFVASLLWWGWPALVRGREAAALRWAERSLLPVVALCAGLAVACP